MFGYLSSIVGTAKAGLPYNVGEAQDDAWLSWKHSKGTSKARAAAPLGQPRTTGTPLAADYLFI